MPSLISVAGNRIALRGGQTYVLGRGRDCDIILDDLACSRRHARVLVHPNGRGAALEDMQSRNGTFLNGQLSLERAPLADGSRICVGGSVFLVRFREDEEDIERAETGTRSLDATDLVADLEGGEFASVGLLPILELLIASRRAVALHVALPEGESTVELREGEVRRAECGGLEGFNALIRLGRAKSGIFWVVECTEESECERNVTDTTARLLVELKRCLDPATSR
ncbi:MAG: FHA domain-containing protein [Planctomycetes bacterium]|nr:FHA domain-containing protein [Planctomycetota bacterium]